MKIMQNPRVFGVNEKTCIFDENGSAIFADVPLRKMIKNPCFFVNARNRRIFMKIMQNPPVPGVNEKTWIFDEKLYGRRALRYNRWAGPTL